MFACSLDIERAMYLRRSAIVSGACRGVPSAHACVVCVQRLGSAGGAPATVEQRWYAHGASRSLLIMEVEAWLNDGSAGPVSVALVGNQVCARGGGAGPPAAAR